LTGDLPLRHRAGMAVLLTRNRALDHGHVVSAACPGARRPFRAPQVVAAA